VGRDAKGRTETLYTGTCLWKKASNTHASFHPYSPPLLLVTPTRMRTDGGTPAARQESRPLARPNAGDETKPRQHRRQHERHDPGGMGGKIDARGSAADRKAVPSPRLHRTIVNSGTARCGNTNVVCVGEGWE
jgi:hypothetical protein